MTFVGVFFNGLNYTFLNKHYKICVWGNSNSYMNGYNDKFANKHKTATRLPTRRRFSASARVQRRCWCVLKRFDASNARRAKNRVRRPDASVANGFAFT